MTAKNFTLYNYSATTATLNQITFETPAGIQHIADLSNFGGYLAGQTAFTGNGTYPFEPATYQGSTRPRTKTYISNSATWLTVNSTGGVLKNYVASGNGFTSGQYVKTVIDSTTFVMSAPPDFSPTPNVGITFTTSTYLLVVDDTTGISPGFVASGNGYTNGQTVVAVTSPTNLTMSAHPNGTTTLGGTINFENRIPIGTLAPGGSIPFTIDHTTSLLAIGTFTTRVEIIGEVGGTVTKVIRNAVVLSTEPVENPNIFFDPSGGAGAATPPGYVDPGSASGSGGFEGSGSSGGSKVICTALYELGHLEKDIFEWDQKFGLWLYENDPVTYKGYRVWADILVEYMHGRGNPIVPKLFFWMSKEEKQQSSQRIALSLAKILGKPFAYELARRYGKIKKFNLFGYLVVSVGLKICWAIGKLMRRKKHG